MYTGAWCDLITNWSLSHIPRKHGASPVCPKFGHDWNLVHTTWKHGACPLCEWDLMSDWSLTQFPANMGIPLVCVLWHLMRIELWLNAWPHPANLRLLPWILWWGLNYDLNLVHTSYNNGVSSLYPLMYDKIWPPTEALSTISENMGLLYSGCPLVSNETWPITEALPMLPAKKMLLPCVSFGVW